MRKETLDAVFSLLPKHSAVSAIERITERASSNVDLKAFEIRWAEFELNGRFLRGGVSDISDLATHIITDSQRDFGIDLLVRRAAQGNLVAGTLDWIARHDLLLWYLPYRFHDEKGRTGIRLRGLVISDDLFGEIMATFNSASQLTTAEKRTIFHLVAGLELRQAAELDKVSYETKRAHTKVACEKLQCTGQKDLVRKAMGQLFHLMSVSDSDLKQMETPAIFADRHLNEDLELVVRRHRSGRTLRYFTGGPEDGSPVIMVHGMMFPVILKGISKFLERHRLRLYVPIRSGYLETGPLATLFEHREQIETELEDIRYLVENECVVPAILVGNSLGGMVALRLALASPQLFSHLVLISTNLAQQVRDEQENASSFYKGMHDLKADTFLFKLVNLEYRKFYSSSHTCRHILKTHFAASKVDLEVLEGTFCGTPMYEMFAATYASSPIGIAEDFRFVMGGKRPDATQLDVPVSVIHGSEDPLTSIREVRTLLGAKLATEHLVEGAGHFAAASHGDEVWGTIANIALESA